MKSITVLFAVIILMAIVFFVGLFILTIDVVYNIPVADNNANLYCRHLGFDQYKSYSRIGIWSTEPVGIKCEYAEKYTDLGVRNNGG